MSKNIVVEFEEILEELVGYPVDMDFKQGFEKDGIENDFIMKIMLCKKLDRIADALEKLNDCVGYIPPSMFNKEGHHILRIGGSVDVD